MTQPSFSYEGGAQLAALSDPSALSIKAGVEERALAV